MKWLKPLQKLGIRNTGLFLGPLLFTVILLSDFQAQNPAVKRMAAVLAFMAVYWVTEALPLAVTSLFPFVLFPILDIMPGKNVAPNYINSTIFLFIGGFLLALAMERLGKQDWSVYDGAWAEWGAFPTVSVATGDA